MSKELTPLEALNTLRNGLIDERIVCITRKTFDKCLDNIETALKDYENLQLKHRSMQDTVLDDFKKLKALEVLKDWFEVVEDESGYHLLTLFDIGKISKEEYDLLKEELL